MLICNHKEYEGLYDDLLWNPNIYLNPRADNLFLTRVCISKCDELHYTLLDKIAKPKDINKRHWDTVSKNALVDMHRNCIETRF